MPLQKGALHLRCPVSFSHILIERAGKGLRSCSRAACETGAAVGHRGEQLAEEARALVTQSRAVVDAHFAPFGSLNDR
jgi:hypothetical protein